MNPKLGFLHVDNTIWIAYGPPLQAPGEFFFEDFFPVRHALRPPENISAIARIGRIPDYQSLYDGLLEQRVSLVNSVDEHFRCAELPGWYPLLEDITPKSMIFDRLPSMEQISANFDWPIFLRGSNHSSRHSRKLSVFHSPKQYESALSMLKADPILRTQKIAVRAFEQLQIVNDDGTDEMPVAVEFRTFWWKENLLGIGAYWNAGGRYWDRAEYEIASDELRRAVDLAGTAVHRLEVPFVVVDLALRNDGKWIVIECNDAQECGYGGVNRQELWEKLISIVKQTKTPSELNRDGV